MDTVCEDKKAIHAQKQNGRIFGNKRIRLLKIERTNIMLVKELVKKLKELDQGKEIRFLDSACAEEKQINQIEDWGKYYVFLNEEES